MINGYLEIKDLKVGMKVRLREEPKEEHIDDYFGSMCDKTNQYDPTAMFGMPFGEIVTILQIQKTKGCECVKIKDYAYNYAPCWFELINSKKNNYYLE